MKDIQNIFYDGIDLEKSMKPDGKFDLHQESCLKFSSNKLECEKFKESDGFLAMQNMQAALDTRIETELKLDRNLQFKIAKVQEAAKKKIEKLKSKPKKKLQEEYGYDRFEKYFTPEFVNEEIS